MYRDIPEELRRLIEPVVLDADLELVDVTLRRGRPPWLLRIIVDTTIGDGRVPVDRCARVSREIETQLDAEDAIESAYRLEVSSPGLDRVLAREKDFLAAQGSEVSLELRRPLDGRRRFRGKLLAFEQGSARLLVDGEPYEVPFDEVAKAKAIYQFTPADFSGKDASGKESQPSEDETDAASTSGKPA
jgi:ribosome maturation factor RimP